MVQLIPVNYATADRDGGPGEGRAHRARHRGGGHPHQHADRPRHRQQHRQGAERWCRSLDTQTPQVLIESRIVEANTNFSRQIGVQWGGFGQAAPATGNPTGLDLPQHRPRSRGGSDTGTRRPPASPATPNFAVNLPAAVGAGAGGALGFIFGSAGGALPAEPAPLGRWRARAR